MRRIFFEKDSHKDYLFVVIDHERELDQIYKVDNFTDETGREYVYTLIGERKKLTADSLKPYVIAQDNGSYLNYNGDEILTDPHSYIERIIDNIELNKEQEIFVYVRNK
ncbi:hypothetical protein [Empedobacter brevis]|uniref:hypothetical protein n=1 Tax=Empedobacter brevis TaxID=247 RepID=UPI0039AF3BDB